MFTLHEALEYHRRGWSVIPLCGKKAASEWKSYQTQRAESSEIHGCRRHSAMATSESHRPVESGVRRHAMAARKRRPWSCTPEADASCGNEARVQPSKSEVTNRKPTSECQGWHFRHQMRPGTLRISERLLWSKTNCGQIPHCRIGRAVVYPIDLLREYLIERASGDDA
jgi:hypothetical protein